MVDRVEPMTAYDLLAFARVPWDGDLRLCRLLSRCAGERRVFVVEPARRSGDRFRLEVRRGDGGALIATPCLPRRTEPELAHTVARHLVDELIADHRIQQPVLWYRSQTALAYSYHLRARAVVYDRPRDAAADDLALAKADVVFVDGHTVSPAARALHHHVEAFAPRDPAPAPAVTPVRYPIPPPRIGFAGDVAHLDRTLLAVLADRRPDLHFLLAADDPGALAERANIHWLGAIPDAELPAHLAAWDVAMLPLERHAGGAAERVIAALAAGLPVVSTSVDEVVRRFAAESLAWIGDGAAAFATAIDNALAEDPARRRERGGAHLASLSYQRTWDAMWSHVEVAVEARARRLRRAPDHTAIGLESHG